MTRRCAFCGDLCGEDDCSICGRGLCESCDQGEGEPDECWDCKNTEEEVTG